MFHEWGNFVVRLDIWHLMRRFACGVTSKSHELYPTFMRQLSHCIFEVDPQDARRLTEAKRSEPGRKRGMFDLSDAEVIQRISKEEWRLHCHRRTRGAVDTAILLQNLLDTFRGPSGRNTLNIPLLDDLHIQDIWEMQISHLSCIQDPPGLQALHPDWVADQRRGQPPSLSLCKGFHIPRVLPPPPEPLHPRDVCQGQVLPGVPRGWSGEVEQGLCSSCSACGSSRGEGVSAVLQWPPQTRPQPEEPKGAWTSAVRGFHQACCVHRRTHWT
ncbi:uncharacterized protein LOC118565614 [Fundulus heteroclitus]|uniref:uncharacterized protein LOC118565614 n=1 Tax=Fundulus heteroclitus TaxID=8078 RepID=UPI00165CD553|nr:uncharacterized protein LOC118565614 [Fundulus heteroclitus]